MMPTETLVSVVAWLMLCSLYCYFSRAKSLLFRVRTASQKIANVLRTLVGFRVLRSETGSHLRRLVSFSRPPITPDSESAIPVEVAEDAPTGRIAYDKILQLVAQSDSDVSAIPVEIAEDAPTKRIESEEILRLAEQCELDALLSDVEVRAGRSIAHYSKARTAFGEGIRA